MKIEKQVYIYYYNKNAFYYYYVNSKTNFKVEHGLYNTCNIGVGYYYHKSDKGFWLINKHWL